jgi:hypothetical protein
MFFLLFSVVPQAGGLKEISRWLTERGSAQMASPQAMARATTGCLKSGKSPACPGAWNNEIAGTASQQFKNLITDITQPQVSQGLTLCQAAPAWEPHR